MNRVCAFTSVGSLKWREVNSYRSFHIDIGRIHLLQSQTIQDLLSYFFARTFAKRSYLALLFLLAWMLIRPSVEYAKDWLDTFHRLSWSSLVIFFGLKRDVLALSSFACPFWSGLSAKRGLVWLWSNGGCNQPFWCTWSHFGMVTNEQTTTRWSYSKPALAQWEGSLLKFRVLLKLG